jgi:hypothetical protein
MRNDTSTEVETFVVSSPAGTAAMVHGAMVSRGDVVRPAAFGARAFVDRSLGGIVIAKGNVVEVVPMSSVLTYRLVNPAPAAEVQDSGPPQGGPPQSPPPTPADAKPPKGAKPKLPEVQE